MGERQVHVTEDAVGLPWGLCPVCLDTVLVDEQLRLHRHGPRDEPLCSGSGLYPRNPNGES